MSDDTRIDELLDRWEDLQAEESPITLEDLCKDCPELLHAVKEQIEAIAWIPSPDADDATHLTFTGEDNKGQKIYYEPVPHKLGRYELKKPIGAGGFGQVWLAYDPELQREVAIKIPRRDRATSFTETDRFLEEARKVAKLQHPNIVPVHDVGEDQGFRYIVSELIEGTNLADRIRSNPLSFSESARIVADLAEALQFAHSQGIVHRDIKPANILLDDQDKPYLVDFGIAASSDEILSEESALAGTLPYMSPRQIRGTGNQFATQSDIYSLGIVLYQLLTGKLPFQANQPSELQKQILKGKFKDPRSINDEIPIEFEVVILKAISNHPSGRYSTAKEMADDLKRIIPANRSKWYRSVRKLSVLTIFVVISILLIFFIKGTELTGKDPPRYFTNSIGMKLQLIPAGEFMMGSSKSDERHRDNELQHRVKISKPYYIGVYEVTQEQWKNVMGSEPWKGRVNMHGYSVKEGPDFPATWVDWNMARDFCIMLSAKEGRLYRLPTEAQWEYACRSGTQTTYSFGEDSSKMDEYGWYGGATNDSGNCSTERYAHEVGLKLPNAWGLYDMHGNAWEWCQDWFDPEYYRTSPASDPTGPSTGTMRALRGGSWWNGPARSAGRNGVVPVYRNGGVGFRVVCDLEEDAK